MDDLQISQVIKEKLIDFIELKGQSILIEKAPKSHQNDNYFVQIDNKPQLVFRFYSPETRNEFHTEELILEELEIQSVFKKHGIPIAEVLRDLHGKTLQKLGNRYFAVFQFIEFNGDQELNVEKQFNIGQLMAKLHNISQRLELKTKRSGREYTFNPFFASYVSVAYPDCDISRFANEKTQLQKEWKLISKKHPMSRCLLHGDIHKNNIIFQENSIKALLDFDDMINGFPLFEILRYFFIGLTFSYRMGKDFPTSKKYVEAFINGYTQQRMLNKNEILSLKVGMAMFKIYGAEMVLQRTPDTIDDYLQKANDLINIFNDIFRKSY